MAQPLKVSLTTKNDVAFPSFRTDLQNMLIEYHNLVSGKCIKGRFLYTMKDVTGDGGFLLMVEFLSGMDRL